jgi:hypothetical protein
MRAPWKLPWTLDSRLGDDARIEMLQEFEGNTGLRLVHRYLQADDFSAKWYAPTVKKAETEVSQKPGSERRFLG